MEKRDFPSERIRRAIRWRRETLEEYESREDPDEGYHGSGITPERRMSDGDIRSMFGGLRR
jgi:hypothetical protein